jgi:hypothetical protein
MAYFVKKHSIVRKIWGDGDTILFIFAGASAEFALNKAVDWLYFTGKLPTDPLGRLFSTVAYARKIVFSDYPSALKTIDQITAIHQNVEKSRGDKIPDWAFRDVLFMLIDYSIRSYEILKKPLSEEEKAEVFEVFNRVGLRMGIQSLPANYEEWELHRANHLLQNLACNPFTHNLYQQYAKHLGYIRYRFLIQAQALVCPTAVLSLLHKHPWLIWLKPILAVYKLIKKIGLQHILRDIILPKNYKLQIRNLDVHRN